MGGQLKERNIYLLVFYVHMCVYCMETNKQYILCICVGVSKECLK